MAVESRHVSASLRMVDSNANTISSYHRIRPNIESTAVDNFLQGVTALRAQTGGNAFLTITTQLVEID